MKTINELTDMALASQVQNANPAIDPQQLRINKALIAARNLVVTLERYNQDKGLFKTAKKQFLKAADNL